MKTLFFWLVLLCSMASAAQIGFRQRTDLTVYFDTGESTLSRKQKRQIREYCRSRENYANPIGVMGYSDTTGTAGMNDTLSIRRAREVAGYMQELMPGREIAAYAGFRDSLHRSLPQEQQRRADVIMGLLCGYYDDPLKYSSEGIYVIPRYLVPKNPDQAARNDEIRIRAYAGAGQMIPAGINAVDTEGNILKVAGMAEICIHEDWTVWQGGKVYVPIRGSRDRNLRLYIKEHDTGRWKDANVAIDFTGKSHYVFEILQSTGCVSFCLGRRAGIKRPEGRAAEPDTYKIVYISTYKPFDFESVRAGAKKLHLSYSATLNDTLMAFTLPAARQSARHMLFEGFYPEGGAAKKLAVPLRRCTYSKDKEGNDWYHISEKSLMREQPAGKKGFWQWLKNVFG